MLADIRGRSPRAWHTFWVHRGIFRGGDGDGTLGDRGASMEQRVSIITLGVADLDRSREFYERLGWRRSMAKAEGIVFFQAGGVALALFPRNELAKDANSAPDGEGFRGLSLAYNVRDRMEVDSVLKDAVAAGATLLKPGQEVFWGGYSGYFSDPDGFLWEVAWNPFFPIAEDGSIRIPD
jgi:catechol 2,3-dioxygenase-like lactoylglutathione lyase family enzyme